MRDKIKIITNEQNCNDIVLFYRFVTILNNETVQVLQHACLMSCFVFCFFQKRGSPISSTCENSRHIQKQRT